MMRPEKYCFLLYFRTIITRWIVGLNCWAFEDRSSYVCQLCNCVWVVESSWNVMAHGDAQEGKCRGNWRMEWVASTLHTTSEHGVSRITTADAHTSAANSRLNWNPRRFKWTRPFRRKTKSGFYPCAITFQTRFTDHMLLHERHVGGRWVK